MMTVPSSMNSFRVRVSAAILAGTLGLSVVAPGLADDAPVSGDDAAVPAAPIPGTLMICGGGLVPKAALTEFVALAGGEQAHIAVVTTASETADSAEVDTRLEFWRSQRLAELTILHTRSREVADDPKFSQPLASVTGVWFIGGHQQRLTDAYLGTRTEKAIKAVLKRGGVVGGTSAGAAIMSHVMIMGGYRQNVEVGQGFGFLPGCLVDQHFLKRNRVERLLHVLNQHPRLVGFGIDENTVLVVQGRKLSVVGDSKVIMYCAPVADKPIVTRELTPDDHADLVALSRSAIARVQPRYAFDGDAVAPKAPQGTLVVAGGGDVPEEAAERFIEAAGGPEATIVVVTTANGERLPADARAVSWIAESGAKNVHVVHPRTRSDAESPTLLALLKKAGGVWFTGGRQWRLVDALQDTPAEKELHELLNRGGVVGGTGGGASMLTDYLVRGGPLSNKDIMAEGYEEGFGFLKGVAIDPFFTQRNRFADMAELKRTHPRLIGLGVDDGTALVVKGSTVEVVGRNQVVVYDRREPAEAQKDFKFLYAGDKYDLTSRERLGPPRTTPEPAVAANNSSSSAAADDDDPEPQPPLACESE